MNQTMTEDSLSRMTSVERGVFEEALGHRKPELCIRSNSRVDGGRWWWGSPVWLLVLERELVVLVAARRRYLCRVAFADAQRSYYSHQAGALILEPAEDLRFREIQMPPSQAIRILRLLGVPV